MNEQLRKHVKSVAFQLTLGHTQISALVAVDMCRSRPNGPWRTAHPMLPHFVPGIKGVERRGLVRHYFPPRSWTGKPEDFHGTLALEYGLDSFYEITTAGGLVLGLLREAGIYAEVEATIDLVPTKSRVEA